MQSDDFARRISYVLIIPFSHLITGFPALSNSSVVLTTANLKLTGSFLNFNADIISCRIPR